MRLTTPLVWKKIDLKFWSNWEADTPLGSFLIETGDNDGGYYVAMWSGYSDRDTTEFVASNDDLATCKFMAEQWLLHTIRDMIQIEVRDT